VLSRNYALEKIRFSLVEALKKLPIDGALKEFLSHIYNFDFWFSIIEPECKGLNFEYQQRYRIIRAQYYVKTGFFIYSLYLQIKLYVPDIG